MLKSSAFRATLLAEAFPGVVTQGVVTMFAKDSREFERVGCEYSLATGRFSRLRSFVLEQKTPELSHSGLVEGRVPPANGLVNVHHREYDHARLLSFSTLTPHFPEKLISRSAADGRSALTSTQEEQ